MKIGIINKNLPFIHSSENRIALFDVIEGTTIDAASAAFRKDNFTEVDGSFDWTSTLTGHINIPTTIDDYDKNLSVNYVYVKYGTRYYYFFVTQPELKNNTTITLYLRLDTFTTYQDKIKFNNVKALYERCHEDRYEVNDDGTLEPLWTLNSYLSVSEEIDVGVHYNVDKYNLNIVYSDNDANHEKAKAMAESFKYYGRHNYLYAIVKDSSGQVFTDKGSDRSSHKIPFGYSVVPLFQGYIEGNTIRLPYGFPLALPVAWPTKVDFDANREGTLRIAEDGKDPTADRPLYHGLNYRTAFNSANIGRIFSSPLPPFGNLYYKDDMQPKVVIDSKHLPKASPIIDFECEFQDIDFTGHGHFKYLNDKITINGIKGRYPNDFNDPSYEPKLTKTLYKFTIGNDAREFREFDPLLFDMIDINNGTTKIKLMRTIDPSATFYRIELPISKKGRTEHLISKGEGVMTFIDTSSLPIGDNAYSQFVATRSNQVEAEYSNARDRYVTSMHSNAVSAGGNIIASLFNPVSWMRKGGIVGALTDGVTNAMEIQNNYNMTNRSIDAKVDDVFKSPMSFSSDASDWAGRLYNRELIGSDTGMALFVERPHPNTELSTLELFTKYGHKTNRVGYIFKVEDLQTRDRFNFVKLYNSSEVISPNGLPLTVYEDIVDTFSKGIRLWKYSKFSTFGTYDVSNWENDIIKEIKK